MKWWQIRKRDADLDRELRSDLELEEEERRESGMHPEEARLAAHRAFGNAILIKEQTHEAWGWAPFERRLQDLRYALRQFTSHPGFACTAVLMLALSAAANTLIFSVVNAVLLKPLPFSHAEQLVRLWDQNTKTGLRDKLTGAEWTTWKTRGSQIASGMAAGWDESYTLTGAGESESLIGYQFTPNIFAILGSLPALGRPFSPNEMHEVVLSDSLWEQHFGRSRQIVGKTITLNKEPYTVIGVMPKGFDFPGKVDVWTPLRIDGSLTANDRLHALHAVVRLKDGVTIPQAQAAFNSIRVDAGGNENRNAVVEPIRNSIVGDARVALWIMQAAVLLLVLVAATNTAGILVARAAARERELAIRVALGAGRSRILLQLIVEGLALASVGGFLGLALAVVGLRLLQAVISENIQLPLPSSIAGWIDWHVFAFAVGVSLFTGLFFSIAPGMRLPSTPNGALGAGERSIAGGKRTTQLRSLLLGLQVAFSLLLLVGSGLLLKSLVRLESQSFGFRTDHVLTTQFVRAAFGPMQDPGWLVDVLQKVDRLPGVESSAAASGIPLSGASARRPYSIPGVKQASADDAVATFHVVTPEWFHTMQIPVIRGRTFTAQDRLDAVQVVVVNTMLANRLWPHDDPIGKTIMVPDVGTPETRVVIGVVGDTRHQGLAVQAQPEIYRPFGQTTFPIVGIAIHTNGDPAALADTVRRVFLSIMPEQPLGPMLTMEDRAASSVALRKESAVMLATFSLIALSLAVVGIYGVVSYSVTRRTREIGIKMVLGAKRSDVIANVMRSGMVAVVVGTAIGLTASLLLTNLLRALLFDVEPLDPATLVATPLLLLSVAAIASYLPARRAALVNPVQALRSE